MKGVTSLVNPIIEELSRMIPKLTEARYKGQNGKIGVIGGSFEYTGAPFYAAQSALYAGADISHIFCPQEAAIPIKCYSPEIIVHPTLHATDIALTLDWLPALNVLTVGPGYGRQIEYLPELIEVIRQAFEQNLSIICDADFFWYYCLPEAKDLRLLMSKNSEKCILTPNLVEFQRLWKFTFKEEQNMTEDMVEKRPPISKQIFGGGTRDPITESAILLSQELNNMTIFQKGKLDIISNGRDSYIVNEEGGLKRCGGQGDILCGILSVFANWARQSDMPLIDACALSSVLLRTASRIAFTQYGRALTTPNIILNLPNANTLLHL